MPALLGGFCELQVSNEEEKASSRVRCASSAFVVFIHIIFCAAPSLGLQHRAGSVCPALSAPEVGVPQGFELLALANHRSGQVFLRAVLWFGRDVHDQALGTKPIVSMTDGMSGKQR